MSAKELIDETRRLDAVAPEGPWTHYPPSHKRHDYTRTRILDGRGQEIAVMSLPPNDAVGEFMARSRELMPALADKLEAALARETNVQATNETLAKALEASERARGALSDWLDEARIAIAAAQRDTIEEEREHAATRARLAPLDGLSEGEREATMMWLQHATQHASEPTRRGATALLMALAGEG